MGEGEPPPPNTSWNIGGVSRFPVVCGRLPLWWEFIERIVVSVWSVWSREWSGHSAGGGHHANWAIPSTCCAYTLRPVVNKRQTLAAASPPNTYNVPAVSANPPPHPTPPPDGGDEIGGCHHSTQWCQVARPKAWVLIEYDVPCNGRYAWETLCPTSSRIKYTCLSHLLNSHTAMQARLRYQGNGRLRPGQMRTWWH